MTAPTVCERPALRGGPFPSCPACTALAALEAAYTAACEAIDAWTWTGDGRPSAGQLRALMDGGRRAREVAAAALRALEDQRADQAGHTHTMG